MAQAGFFEELVLVLAQFHADRGPAAFALTLADGEFAGAVGYPAPGLVLTRALADHLHFGRNHEGRIEADTEFADGVQIGAVFVLVFFEIGRRAGPGDGAEV